MKNVEGISSIDEIKNILQIKPENIYYPKKIEKNENWKNILKIYFEKPIGCSKLKINGNFRIGILFDDITRPTPIKEMLDVFIDLLIEAGAEQNNIYLIHAPGLHISGKIEIKEKIGSKYFGWPTLFDHDARNSDMTYKGITHFGTPVWVNSVIEKMDILIGFGSIRPHMDAGFSGGNKIILPGIASKNTIDSNHKMMLSPNSKMGELKGNPVREDMEEAGKLVGLNYILNVTVNEKKEITDVFFGDPLKAHRVGVKSYIEKNGTLFNKKNEIVIINSQDIYLSSVFGELMKADMITDVESIIILNSPNSQEWAPFDSIKKLATFPMFYMFESTEKLAERICKMDLEEVRHVTAAFNFKNVCERKKIFLVTSKMFKNEAKFIGLDYFEDIKTALSVAKSSFKIDVSPIFLADAKNIFPVMA